MCCQNVCKEKFHYNFDKTSSVIFYEALPAVSFREEVEDVKIWFSFPNFVVNVGGATNTRTHNPGT